MQNPGWEAIGAVLERRNARMSVAYTPGWVDDGDPQRGELLVAGEAVERVPGRVHPSPLVRYIGKRAHSADCAGEFEGVRALTRRGLCEAELHGYTHVHPDLERWAVAPGRHQKLGWYRELGAEMTSAIAARGPERHPIALGLELWRQYLGEPPCSSAPATRAAPTRSDTHIGSGSRPSPPPASPCARAAHSRESTESSASSWVRNPSRRWRRSGR